MTMRSAATLLLLVASCRFDATQVVVTVDSDLHVPAEVASVRATVLNPEGEVIAQRRFELDSAGPGLPLSFGVVSPDGETTVEVDALGPTGVAVLSHRRSFTFEDQQTLLLRVFLAHRCIGVMCDPGFTCAQRGCMPEAIPPGGLEAVAPGDELPEPRTSRPDAGPVAPAELPGQPPVAPEPPGRTGRAGDPMAAGSCGDEALACERDSPGSARGRCLERCELANPRAAGGDSTCTSTQAICARLSTEARQGRCVRPVGAFGDPHADPTARCDPRRPNLRELWSPSGAASRCVPLCTLTPSRVSPVFLNCDGERPECAAHPIAEDDFGNTFAVCAKHRVRRGMTCRVGGNEACEGSDACAFGKCRRVFSDGCWHEQACGAGYICHEVSPPLDGARVGVCVAACGDDGACGEDEVCAPLGGARGTTASEDSRRGCVRSGASPVGSSCSDPLGLGSARWECVGGASCVPRISYEDATCEGSASIEVERPERSL